MGKLKTPEWILMGYKSREEYERETGKKASKKKEGKIYKIKICPKCKSNEVRIVLSNLDSEEETNTGKQWECLKCKWKGKNIDEKEVNEDEFLEHIEKMEGE